MDPISSPSEHDVLIVVDVQNDFCPGGALAVPGGGEVATIASRLGSRFANVVLTQDWHPADHKSFASAHEGKAPFEMTAMPYGDQVLWPDHCIQGSHGAEFRLTDATLQKAQIVIRKGFRPEVDSYSAFLENDQTTPTGLAGYMKERGLTRAVFAGLALDFCVGFSAIDAVKLGFEAVVVLDGCRGIAAESIEERLTQMREAGVQIVDAI